jgi:hypothetical protein
VVDVSDDAKVARVFYSHEKARIIRYIKGMVNLKLRIPNKTMLDFHWP